MARRREEETNEDGDDQHPALKSHSRVGSQVKHVAKGTFKGALVGGAVGAGVLAGAASLATVAMFASNPIGWAAAGLMTLTGVGSATVAGAVTTAAVTGATWGATVGAGTGGLFSAASASEAADAEEDKIINKYEQASARKERMDRLRDVRDRQAMAMERQEAQMRGANPNRSLPQGRGQEGMAVT